jgi:diguanylate cyclase (GGDEF)-like protein
MADGTEDRCSSAAWPAGSTGSHSVNDRVHPVMSCDGEQWLSLADGANATLHGQAPLDLWMVTRLRDADQVVVAVAGPWSRTFPVGSELSWFGSFGLPMAAGSAPAVALKTRDVPQYAAAAHGLWRHVRGFTGVPLLVGDGELAGTWCGFSAQEDTAALLQAQPLLRSLGEVFSALIDAEKALAVERQSLRAAVELAERDALTGLLNRRGWSVGVAKESERSRRYEEPAGLVSLDLDGLKSLNDTQGHAAGDALLKVAAEVLRVTCRPSDLIARVGGDEFAVLAVEVGAAGLGALVTRIRSRFEQEGISASAGGASQLPGEDLRATWLRADSDMYDDKRARHGAGVRVTSARLRAVPAPSPFSP